MDGKFLPNYIRSMRPDNNIQTTKISDFPLPLFLCPGSCQFQTSATQEICSLLDRDAIEVVDVVTQNKGFH